MKARFFLLTMIALFFLIPARSAEAKWCVSQWSYSLGSLQEARRRIKSPVHHSAASRVRCGRDVISALNLTEWPAQVCSACSHEYIQLLRDLVVFTRSAAEDSAARDTKLAYYRLEIEIRIMLGNYLVKTEDESLIEKYWSHNFEGMGDAMNRSNLAKEFHLEVLRNRNRSLTDKIFDTWAKAIRSCEKWNFRRGENHNLESLKRSLLCAVECRQALTKIRARASIGQAVDKAAVSDILDTLLPALEACPAKEGL
jgi:hypothetical protein